jgi:5-methylcytosine-specific restriction endonuclease McrA
VKDTRAHPRFMLTPASIAWIDGVSLDAFTLWCALELYQCRMGGTALVPKSKLHAATARRMSPKRIDVAVAELLDEGQLVDHGDALELVVWEQPPVEVWQDDVLRWRFQRNNRLKSMNELKTLVRQRDRSLCRYCGIRVTWGNDHRSPTSGTFDHVDPDGDNTPENLVVACRRCNGRKKDRTPEQASMKLLDPGTVAADAKSVATAPIGAEAPGHAAVPEQRSGSDPGRNPVSDPVPTRSNPGQNLGPPGARTRDRKDPVRTGSGPGPTSPAQAGSAAARPNDGSVPRLLQTGGAVRVRVEDPAHPQHQSNSGGDA